MAIGSWQAWLAGELNAHSRTYLESIPTFHCMWNGSKRLQKKLDTLYILKSTKRWWCFIRCIFFQTNMKDYSFTNKSCIESKMFTFPKFNLLLYVSKRHFCERNVKWSTLNASIITFTLFGERDWKNGEYQNFIFDCTWNKKLS